MDKIDFAQLLNHLHIFALSSLFGLASYLLKVRQNKISATLFNFISELVFACVSGYIAMKLSLYWNMDENLKWVFISISSWSGTKFLIFLEGILEKYIMQKFNLTESDKQDLDNNEEKPGE